MVILTLRRVEVRPNVYIATFPLACRRVRSPGIKLNRLCEKRCLSGSPLHASSFSRTFKQFPKGVGHVPSFTQVGQTRLSH